MVCFHHGDRLTEWLQPFFIISPALIVACVVTPDARPVRSANVLLMSAAALVLVGYSTVMMANVSNAGQKRSGIIPFSHKAEQLWQERYNVPLRLVGGERLAEWLTFIHHPDSNYHSLDNSTKPRLYNANITLAEIQHSGALLIGQSNEKCTLASFTRMP